MLSAKGVEALGRLLPPPRQRGVIAFPHAAVTAAPAAGVGRRWRGTVGDAARGEAGLDRGDLAFGFGEGARAVAEELGHGGDTDGAAAPGRVF